MAQFYEEGNNHFQEHRYESALDAYLTALSHSESSALSLKLHLNVSICALKLRLYEEAVKASTNALEIDPKNVKALIRRSSAREYMGDFKKSLADLQVALDYSPPSLCLSVTRDIRRLSCMLEKDTAVLKDGGVWKDLIRPGQALRLMFVDPPPRIVKLDTEYKAKVCIGSEFGLWDKGNMQSKGDEIVPVFILCKLSFIGESQTCRELTFTSDNVEIGKDGKVFR
jgi:tetratricopeptide (TPR) repeat protein